MKKDLIIALFVAVLGISISYFVTNIFVQAPTEVKYKTVDAASLSASISTPDNKVFNYLAINPTVEVYIGNCERMDINGNCIVSSDRRAELLREAKEKYKEKLGYYDEYGYYHQYEIVEGDDGSQGFYDYNGDFFTIVENGYYDEEDNFYSFDSSKNGFYDGAQYRGLYHSVDEDEEDAWELDDDEDIEDVKSSTNKSSNRSTRNNSYDEEE